MSLFFFIVATIVVVDVSRVELVVTEFESMSGVAATSFNVDPAFGIAGPLESYEPFPASAKFGTRCWVLNEIRESYFWGGGFWKVGCYVGTTGAVSEAVVERYIEETEHEHRNTVVDGEQEFEAVFARPILDSILADHDQARLLEEILESGRADIYSFDGTFPYVMGIHDGRYVGIAAVDERGIPPEFAQIDDQTVCAWVSDTIDHYRQRATPVTASMVVRSLEDTIA